MHGAGEPGTGTGRTRTGTGGAQSGTGSRRRLHNPRSAVLGEPHWPRSTRAAHPSAVNEEADAAAQGRDDFFPLFLSLIYLFIFASPLPLPELLGVGGNSSRCSWDPAVVGLGMLAWVFSLQSWDEKP